MNQDKKYLAAAKMLGSSLFGIAVPPHSISFSALYYILNEETNI